MNYSFTAQSVTASVRPQSGLRSSYTVKTVNGNVHDLQ